MSKNMKRFLMILNSLANTRLVYAHRIHKKVCVIFFSCYIFKAYDYNYLNLYLYLYF